MNEDISKYKEFGYCIVRNAIPQSKLKEIQKDILEAIEGFKQHPNYPEMRTMRFRDYAPELHMSKKSVEDVLRSESVAELIKKTIGGNADLRFSMTMTKTAEKAESFDWHQDAACDANPQDAQLSCWFAITNSKKTNGCLRIIEKSHKNGLVRHIDSRLHYPDKEIEIVDETQSIDVEMEMGDMIIMDYFLIHSSWPNASGELRIALLSGFMKPKKEYLNWELNSSRKYLRGFEKCWSHVQNSPEV